MSTGPSTKDLGGQRPTVRVVHPLTDAFVRASALGADAGAVQVCGIADALQPTVKIGAVQIVYLSPIGEAQVLAEETVPAFAPEALPPARSRGQRWAFAGPWLEYFTDAHPSGIRVWTWKRW